jgi:hypothetical protein
MLQAVYDFLFVNAVSSFAGTVLVGIVLAAVAKILDSRGRLRWAYPSQYAYSMPMQDGNLAVWTRLMWVANGGSAPLEDVEVVLNFRPQHYEVWPPRPFDTKALDNDREAILFGNLAPHETVTIAFLESRPGMALGDVVSVRSKNDTGKAVPVHFVRSLSRVTYMIIGILLCLGAAAVLQFVVVSGVQLFGLLPSPPSAP